jgi:hypothetical protein
VESTRATCLDETLAMRPASKRLRERESEVLEKVAEDDRRIHCSKKGLDIRIVKAD